MVYGKYHISVSFDRDGNVTALTQLYACLLYTSSRHCEISVWALYWLLPWFAYFLLLVFCALGDRNIDILRPSSLGLSLIHISRAAGVGDPADADDGGLLNIGINAPVVDMVVGAGDGHGGPRRHFHAGMIGLRVRAERVRVGLSLIHI